MSALAGLEVMQSALMIIIPWNNPLCNDVVICQPLVLQSDLEYWYY